VVTAEVTREVTRVAEAYVPHRLMHGNRCRLENPARQDHAKVLKVSARSDSHFLDKQVCKARRRQPGGSCEFGDRKGLSEVSENEADCSGDPWIHAFDALYKR
jgi:hypothetical protein